MVGSISGRATEHRAILHLISYDLLGTPYHTLPHFATLCLISRQANVSEMERQAAEAEGGEFEQIGKQQVTSSK